ncbi:hypothetical protein [Streptomyces sp. NPDC047108]|uniref:hypothetical protein n=1 Tax=Streptomyces sp. NPDC047108 TaxID=3155025 RepID=UPI0033FA1DAF
MRTSIKASIMAVATAGLIVGSAVTASATEAKGHHDDADNTNICGNVNQEQEGGGGLIPALLGGDYHQSAEGPVICQNGEKNTVNRESNDFTLLDLGHGLNLL